MARYDFLCIDDFLCTEIDARAIKTALETRVLDLLSLRGPLPVDVLAAETCFDSRGLRFLLDLLAVNQVIERTGESVALTAAFGRALRFRDLLESRIAFADLVWTDIHTLFTPMLTDLPRFMAHAKVFELFRYDRCFDATAENLESTRRWVEFTTCLTRYESRAVLDSVDLASVGTMTDLGGNSGEFALRVCERHPALHATVVDLPVVCALGREHLAASAGADEARRVRFFPADMRRDPLPEPGDLVSFKSVLHDWPEQDVEHLLERAAGLVRPGGRMIIFERGPIEVGGRKMPYSMVPNLVFLKFLRQPEFYLKTLAQLGFAPIEVTRVELDMAFNLIVASKPA